MTKKRIKLFRSLTVNQVIDPLFVDKAITRLRHALGESLSEIERLKHRCKKRCGCGSRCFRIKGHANDHGWKSHKSPAYELS